MKPTKPQKKISAKTNTSIQTYFKSAPKEPVACDTRSSSVKSVYVHALLDKLKSFDDKVEPGKQSTSGGETLPGQGQQSVNEIGISNLPSDPVESHECVQCGKWRQKCKELETSDPSKTVDCGECNKWRAKYKEMEKSYLKLSVCYTELMMKHNDLVQLSTGALRPSAESEQREGVQQGQGVQLSVGAANSKGETDVSPAVPGADNIFTTAEIKCLRCIALDRKKDSTFILNCVQYAYKNNTAALTNKTLKGTRTRYEIIDGEPVTMKQGKDPLTPEKVARIQELFVERVTKSKCMSAEFGERVKQTNFNQLMANAIKNLSNKEAPKDVSSKLNDDLNL